MTTSQQNTPAPMPKNWLDRTIESVAPSMALRRMEARRQLQIMAQYSAVQSSRQRRYRSITTDASADYQVAFSQDLWTLRETARELERENPLAAGILQTATSNVIGDGFGLRVTTPDTDFNKRAEAYFWDWQPDPRGLLSFLDFQRIAYRSAMRDGDVAFIPANGKLIPIEGDRIATPRDVTLPDGNFISNGVEMDAYGVPVNYWISATSEIMPTTCQPVTARDIIFVARVDRFSQTRGVPELATIAQWFDRLEDYQSAVVLAAQLSAAFALLIKKDFQGGLTRGTEDANGDRVEEIRPGSIQYLNPGESIEQVKPEQPGQNANQIIQMLCRFIGRRFGLPLELVLLDFSVASFGGMRSALQQAYRPFKQEQVWFANSFLRRCYQYRISRGIKMGELAPPKSGTPWSHEWIGCGFAWPDVLKDAQADILLMNNNIISRASVCSKYGGDWADVAEQRAAERQTDIDLKIIPTAMPTTTPITLTQE